MQRKDHGGPGGWLINPNENLLQVYLPNQLPRPHQKATRSPYISPNLSSAAPVTRQFCHSGLISAPMRW